MESWLGVLIFVFLAQSSLAVERNYYIAAVLIEWDYYGNQREGATYKKVVFREYEAGFQMAKPHPVWSGLLGPTLHGEVGDVIIVNFKNMADRPYTIHPHGIAYGKQSEGSLYFDNTSVFEKKDDEVPPGCEHKYTWEVTEEITPMENDPPCLTYSYFSHANLVKDYNSGLIGAMLICKPGTLSNSGSQIHFDKEYVLLFGVFDENKSWYRTESEGAAEQIMYTINGYVNGTLPDVSICAHTPVSWHLLGMSSEPEIFAIHFNGQVLWEAGHKVSSINLITASSSTANMTAKNPGLWKLSSQVHHHLEAGMHGYLRITTCEGKEPKLTRLTIKEARQSQVWTYYIAAEEITWDYAPNLPEYSESTFKEFKQKYLQPGPQRIGQKYKKAVYVQYSDNTFTTKVEDKQRKMETGILGPVVRAQIRDVIKIVFKNRASRPYSIYPQGLTINKTEEGASYPDDGLGNHDHEVKPGQTHTYTWKVTKEDEPTDNDPRCLTRLYHSAVDMSRDIASGLIGPLLICKSQSLNKRNVQLKADKEQMAVMAVFDENKSWYIDENIQTYCTEPSKVNKEDPEFYETNVMHSINGYVYDSGQFLGFCHGEIVTWHVLSVGIQDYIQTAHFYGHTFDVYDRSEDVLNLFPMMGETIAMDMDNVGHWLLASLNSRQSNQGMRLKFKDVECYKEDYYYSDDDEKETDISMKIVSVWLPEDIEMLGKEEEEDETLTKKSAGTHVEEDYDPETEFWHSQLGLRSAKNKSQGLIPEEDLLDISSLLGRDYEGSASGKGIEKHNHSISATLQNNTSSEMDSENLLLTELSTGEMGLVEEDLLPMGSSEQGRNYSSADSTENLYLHAADIQLSIGETEGSLETHLNNSVPISERNRTMEQENGAAIVTPERNVTSENLDAQNKLTMETLGQPNVDLQFLQKEVMNESISGTEASWIVENSTSEGSVVEPTDNKVFIYFVPPPTTSTNDSLGETENNAEFVLLDSGTVQNVLDDNDHVLGDAEHQATMLVGEFPYEVHSAEAKVDGEDQHSFIPAASSDLLEDTLNSEMTSSNNSHVEDQTFTGPVVVDHENSNVTDFTNQTLGAHSQIRVGSHSIASEQSSPSPHPDTDIHPTSVPTIENHTTSETQPDTVALTTDPPGATVSPVEMHENITEGSRFESQDSSEQIISENREDSLWGTTGVNLNITVFPDTMKKSSSEEQGYNSTEEDYTEEGKTNNHTSSPIVSINSTEAPQPHDTGYKSHSIELELSPSAEDTEDVLIYLKNMSKEAILTTSLNASNQHWGYDGKPQTVPEKIPPHMTKYTKDKSMTDDKHNGTNKKPRKKRPVNSSGVKIKRRKSKQESRVLSPRGHKPPSIDPRGHKPITNSEDLTKTAIVIGLPRRDFNDYELFRTDIHDHEMDNEEVEQLGNSYEYVEYKDPYTSNAGMKNMDETVKYFLKNEKNARTYYIAAEEVEWDYAGYKGQRRYEDSIEDKRNTQFKKVVFRSYLDSTFNTPAIRGEVNEHLGILGPVLKAEVNQNIMVVFKNSASRPYSMHAHGVSYGKQMEGMKYNDTSPHWYQFDDAVQPGSTYTYVWRASAKMGPQSGDSACRTWVYYSGVNAEKDINSGLIGPLLICRKGVLNNSTFDSREFVLLFMTFDENKSWYFEEYMQKNQRTSSVSMSDVEFRESNRFHSINGIIFSLKGLRMYTKQLVRWHLINMGSPKDLHTIHFHGQTFLNKQTKDYRLGVYPLLPGSFADIEMKPSKPGLWLLESEVGEFQQRGMQTLFLVLDEDCNHPLGLQSESVKDRQITASQYTGDWRPHLARLHNTGKYNAWSITEDSSAWIQVDFQRPVVISKVATQGAKQLFSSHYVTQYQISYSTDRRRWIFYKGYSDSFKMTFEGNKDSYGVMENIFFPPLIGRYIRLHPTQSYGRPTLRMEFYGCEVDGCSVPLGMKSGQITNDQITASSVYYAWYHGTWQPWLARLDNQGNVNAWRTKANNVFQWLQIELKEIKKITGIITQGAKYMRSDFYVETYSLQYSMTGTTWTTYTDDSDIPEKIFVGNSDNNGHVKNYIYPPIFAKFIRIIPKTWHNSITLRVELLGCDFQ
ncbi:coagulation factor V [Amia ocellicauda]|uniref:coagulation factor V n=1 Tax=Amia ocellicauda TaxID=2972642 RepID=UPI0034641EF8